MPKNEPALRYTRFKGVNNTERPTRLAPDENGVGWLADAENVDIDDSFGIVRRPGYALLDGTPVTAAFATRDEQRLYIVADGELQRVDSISPWSTMTLQSGLPNCELQWCEAGNLVMFAGSAAGIIDNDQVLPFGIPAAPAPAMTAISGSLPAGQYRAACVYEDQWGRQGGTAGETYLELQDGQGIQFALPAQAGFRVHLYVSTANGEQLYLLAETTDGAHNWFSGHPGTIAFDPEQARAHPLPAGADVLAFMGSRIWAAEYDTASDTSYIYQSKPFFYHLFDPFEYIPVPGRVLMMTDVRGGAEYPESLIIGTDREIYAYADGGALVSLAPYGAVPGQPAMRYEGRALLWTQRGLCTALPFQNLTDTVYSVPPGSRCGIGLREADGRKMVVVLTDRGGTANNSH